jgi:hypothetical protein
MHPGQGARRDRRLPRRAARKFGALIQSDAGCSSSPAKGVVAPMPDGPAGGSTASAGRFARKTRDGQRRS